MSGVLWNHLPAFNHSHIKQSRVWKKEESRYWVYCYHFQQLSCVRKPLPDSSLLRWVLQTLSVTRRWYAKFLWCWFLQDCMLHIKVVITNNSSQISFNNFAVIFSRITLLCLWSSRPLATLLKMQMYEFFICCFLWL
jgi:hypothetical protein